MSLAHGVGRASADVRDVVPPEKNRFDCLMQSQRSPKSTDRLGRDARFFVFAALCASVVRHCRQALEQSRSSLREEAPVAFCTRVAVLIGHSCELLSEFRGVTLASAVV